MTSSCWKDNVISILESIPNKDDIELLEGSNEMIGAPDQSLGRRWEIQSNSNIEEGDIEDIVEVKEEPTVMLGVGENIIAKMDELKMNLVPRPKVEVLGTEEEFKYIYLPLRKFRFNC
ncbi:hypothetical protein L1887_35226 [Cichorium endivia]|nr:hypothetical protein L1887_35226 [Cichorium endivia]